ncbi:hypothetical protein EVAR_83279_1 [Eumeta japonica]|uniref:Ig-like domain-containing protein n=1 Tax=Eumeta variegata TaxID=151549 RepID=A0A4C1X943_EUMVA|nr:hypothetical protein EVAR_83279_1 [Eumeta japonica]
MFLKNILLPLFVGIQGRGCLGKEVEQDFAIDRGTNITLPCEGPLDLPNVIWIHSGNRTHHEILKDGSLFVRSVSPEDGGGTSAPWRTRLRSSRDTTSLSDVVRRRTAPPARALALIYGAARRDAVAVIK